MNLFDPGLWETASYVVTVIGLPVAIAIFIADQRKERRNEEEESWQRLSDAYNDFLQVVIDHPDLKLRTGRGNASLTPEQEERMMVIFTMLIGLFERAYASQLVDVLGGFLFLKMQDVVEAIAWMPSHLDVR